MTIEQFNHRHAARIGAISASYGALFAGTRLGKKTKPVVVNGVQYESALAA